MVGIVKRLRHACSLPSQQGELVADALSHMTMGSASHVEEAKKDLVKDVHRLVLGWKILRKVVLWSIITTKFGS